MDRPTRRLLLAGLLVSLIVAGVVSQFASSSPDGLEYVAEQEGFADAAEDSATAGSPLADYGGEDRGRLTVSGIVGVVASMVVGTGLLWLAVRMGRRSERAPVDGA